MQTRNYIPTQRNAPQQYRRNPTQQRDEDGHTAILRNTAVPAADQREDRPIDHKSSRIKFEHGVAARYTCTKILSEDQKNVIKAIFPNLIMQKDQSRVSFEGAYELHEHAIGNIFRAVSESLIYSLAKGEVLQYGGAFNRLISTIESVNGRKQSMLVRTHCANPELSAADDLRWFENAEKTTIKAEAYNIIERAKAESKPIDWKAHTCQHAQGGIESINEDCPCTKDYGSYVAVESVYYPGVLSDIKSRLTVPDNRTRPCAYFAFNNYVAALKKRLDANSDTRKIIGRSIVESGHDISQSFEGTTNHKGVPESVHRLFTKNNTLYVEAVVEGNRFPYKHHVPMIPDLRYFREVQGEVTLVYERIARFWNGEIPYDTYKVTPVRTKSFTNEEMEGMPHHTTGLETNLLVFYDDCLTEISEILKTPVTNPTPTEVVLVKSKIEAIENIMTLYTRKERKKLSDSLNIDILTHNKRMASHNQFMEWCKLQFSRSDGAPGLSLRAINGETKMILKNTKDVCMGFFKTVDASCTVIANVHDVMEAYVKIGAKQNLTSVYNVQVNAQKQMADPDSKTLLDVSDAYIIAYYLRACERSRLAKIVANFPQ